MKWINGKFKVFKNSTVFLENNSETLSIFFFFFFFFEQTQILIFFKATSPQMATC